MLWTREAIGSESMDKEVNGIDSLMVWKMNVYWDDEIN